MKLVSALCIMLPVFACFASRSGAGYAGAAKKGKTPLERAIAAVNTGDLDVMRTVLAELRREGVADLAQKMARAIEVLERMEASPQAEWPADADAVLDPEINTLGLPLTQDDLMVAAWLRHEEKGAPAFTTADLYPDRQKRRALTPHERWVLTPYFPVKMDLERAELRFETPPNMQANPNLWALTYEQNSRVIIYLPNGPQSMLNRFWTALLAHELVHGAQRRVGATDAQTQEAMIRGQYTYSPLEVQARFYQRLVFDDLAVRARAFFLSRGPLPLFP